MPKISLSNEQVALLNDTYRNPVGSAYMGSVAQVYNASRKKDSTITAALVRHWLLAQPSYALAPPVRYKVKHEHIIAYNRNDLGAADLAEFQPLSQFNNGIHYVLVYRNCFTKRISVGFLRSKHGDECAKVFREMLISQIKFVPRILITDRGGEFLNPFFRGVCNEFNIKMFQPRKGKAVHAENAILYLKIRIYRYMRDTNNKRFIDILPQIVLNYNNSIRPILGMSPNEVGAHNQFKLFHKMYGKYLPSETSSSPKFTVGDIVRVRLDARTFEKSFFHKYSTELYKVTTILLSNPPKYDVQALQDATATLRLLERELLLAPQEIPEIEPKHIGLHQPSKAKKPPREILTRPLAKRKMQTRRDVTRKTLAH